VPSKFVTNLTVLILVCSAPVWAQVSEDPIEAAQFRFGPIGFTPSAALTNVGLDTNVFNDVENPQRDFTFTFAPRVEAWFRAGRSRTSITVGSGANYFRRFASQRSIDLSVSGRVDLLTNRVKPWVAAGLSSGRQRVGYEVDLRSRRRTQDVSLGADLRVGAKTTLALSALRTEYNFGEDDFLGSNLRETLNHDTASVSAEVQYALSVLTTFILRGEALQDRFPFSPGRNADSIRVLSGFELGDRALISGSVRVGYRRFTPLGPGVPSYTGAVATFATGATVRGRTRLSLEGERDIVYSFERVYPYYVITGGIFTVTPRLTPAWDIQGRIGGQRLAYRTFGGSTTPDRLDRVVTLGAGVGYNLARETRVGMNLEHQRRSSPLLHRSYSGFRVFSSVTYGS
jgi:hypothetical protein